MITNITEKFRMACYEIHPNYFITKDDIHHNLLYLKYYKLNNKH